MRIRMAGIAGAILLLPAFGFHGSAGANSISFEIWPGTDPDQVISCVIRWQRGQISAVEVMTGLYIQQGLDLPEVFDRLIVNLLPGGMCDGAVVR